MYVSIKEPTPATASLAIAGKNQDVENMSPSVRVLFAEANQTDDLLKTWLQEQKKKVPTPVLLARFATDEYSNERLETLLDLGFDSWIVGVPPLTLIEKICAKISNDVVCVSSTYGRIFLQGNQFWRGKKQIKLSIKESLILRILLKARNVPVSIAQLLIANGYKPDTNTHTIETHIYRMKQKLKQLGMEEVIKNKVNEGYVLLL